MPNVTTILEKSIAEIDAGFWICGDLCNAQFNEKIGEYTKKMMACAVGMVSLYGGHSTVKTLTIKGKLYNIKYALYPSELNDKGNEANANVRKTLEYLVRSIPKADLEVDGVYNEVTDEFDVRTLANIKLWSLQTLSDTVVNYNDGAIARKRVPAASAKAWFVRALKMAQKDAAKVQAAKKPMHTNMNLTESKTLSFV